MTVISSRPMEFGSGTTLPAVSRPSSQFGGCVSTIVYVPVAMQPLGT